MIAVTEDQLLSLVREELKTQIAELRPLIREELLKSLQLVDEAGALAMFPIAGKDPRRTFRRLANKHKLEYVRIDGFKWWKVSGIVALMESHTVNRKSSNRESSGQPNLDSQFSILGSERNAA